MDNFSWMNSFEPFFFWLRVAGLWPNNGSYTFDIYTFYSAMCVTLFIFLHAFFQTVELFMAKLNLNILAAAVLVAGHIMLVVKVGVFFKELPTIKKLISTFDHPQFQPRSKIQVEMTKTNLTHWMVLYRTFQIGFGTGATSIIIRPILDGSYKGHSLPLFAWYPMDIVNTVYYLTAYCHQIVGLCYTAIAQVNLDGLLVAFIVYIGAQCDILCENLRQAKKLFDLVKCLEHHKQIITLFTDFNHLLSNIILVQMLNSVATMALVLFRLSMTGPGAPEFYPLLMITIFGPLEIFLYCWYGNEVETKSAAIARAIFESHWVGATPEFQKVLLVFGMRTQQPMVLTALNLFPVSVGTFVTIMRTGWSYFVVLRQLKNK